ncbi:adenylyl-sulfate kinase [Deefgea sp. CFH1-16]|uniref:adenylyl-sulfate kinase n=1 Tax=Deefgea sp. CFH1-16 TaxID=2675457 RepID=UPI001940313E|nr:adenylyl-sulfate kinase [Deefgea sp. CFH1-16]
MNYQKPSFRNDYFVANCKDKTSIAEQNNLTTELYKVSKLQRSQLKKQKPILIWFTGISGSGKSTLANLLDSYLHNLGYHSCVLDGDNVRQGLNADLGFSEQDRQENIRRIGHVSRLMVDAGLIVITAFISPFAKDRAAAKALFSADEFFEIHLDMPIEQAAQHDKKRALSFS